MTHGKFSVIVGSCSEYANIVQGYWWINNPDSPNNYVCSGSSQLSQSIAENSGIYSLLFRGSWDPQIFLFPCAKLRQNLLQEPLQSLASTHPMKPFYYVIHKSKTRFWRQSLHLSFLLCYRLFPKGINSGYTASLKIWNEKF